MIIQRKVGNSWVRAKSVWPNNDNGHNYGICFKAKRGTYRSTSARSRELEDHRPPLTLRVDVCAGASVTGRRAVMHVETADLCVECGACSLVAGRVGFHPSIEIAGNL